MPYITYTISFLIGSKEDKLEVEPKDITTFSNNDSSVVPSDSISSTKKR